MPSPDLVPTPRNQRFLKIAFGFVYLHFGLLKLFPDLSPAEMIATQTVQRLSYGWVDARFAMHALAVFECGIGLCFLFDIARRALPWLFLGHMIGTAAPLFILPELTFRIAPFAPTLEGQYILKNLVFAAAGWSLLAPPVGGWSSALARIAGRLSIPGFARDRTIAATAIVTTRPPN